MKTHQSELSDVEIISRILNGDVNSFEHLLDRYQDHVLRIVKKHVPYGDAEDTIQDVFIRVYKALPNFKEKGSFKQWLSAIAVKTCYDFWRKRYRSKELPMSDLTENHREWLKKTLSDQSGRSFQEERREEKAKELLDWAMNKLSAKDRMVLELVYFEGLSMKEVAGLLGWSTANVKVRSFRSRKKLETLLMELI
jgi:RNA polymerase sigma-70 factor (ECF subfamily)